MDNQNLDKQTVLLVVDMQEGVLGDIKVAKKKLAKAVTENPSDLFSLVTTNEDSEKRISDFTKKMENYVNEMRGNGAQIIWVVCNERGEVHSNITAKREDNFVVRTEGGVYDKNEGILNKLKNLKLETGKPLQTLVCGVDYDEEDVLNVFTDLRAIRSESCDVQIVWDMTLKTERLEEEIKDYPDPVITSEETLLGQRQSTQQLENVPN